MAEPAEYLSNERGQSEKGYLLYDSNHSHALVTEGLVAGHPSSQKSTDVQIRVARELRIKVPCLHREVNRKTFKGHSASLLKMCHELVIAKLTLLQS